MGRRGLDKADVVRAYVTLLRDGRKPTLLNMRLELGQGSYTTIASRLQELRFVGVDGQYLYGRPAGTRGPGRPRKPYRLGQSAVEGMALR
jgi:hypothetical protein